MPTTGLGIVTFARPRVHVFYHYGDDNDNSTLCRYTDTLTIVAVAATAYHVVAT